jgi:hypothetical protein
MDSFTKRNLSRRGFLSTTGGVPLSAGALALLGSRNALAAAEKSVTPATDFHAGDTMCGWP